MYITEEPSRYDEFEVGDRVKFVYSETIYPELLGQDATILESSEKAPSYVVRFDFDNRSCSFYKWKFISAKPKLGFKLDDSLFEVE